MADGVLTFDTKCDVTGVNNASKVVEGSLKRMGGKIKATFGMTDAEKAAQRVQSLKQSYDNATAAVERQKQKVEALRAEIKALQEESARKSSAAALAETPAAAQPLIEQAESLKAQIAEAKENVAVYREKWKNGEGGADKTQSDWLEKVRNLKNEYAEICDKIDQIIAKEQTASAKSGGESQKIEKLNTELVQSEAKLGSLAGKADLAKKKLNSASDAKKVRKLSMAFGNASTSVKRFTRRLSSIVSSALIFTVITKALTKLREQFGATLKTNKQFTDSWAKIKGNLLTAFQPIYEACLPALLTLMKWLENVTAKIAAFMALISKKSVTQMQKNAKALYKQSTATKSLTKATKEANRQLAAFDELNVLSSKDKQIDETISIPDFDKKIDELTDNLSKSLAMTIDDVFFNWDNLNPEQIAKKAISGLGGLLGGVTGFMIGGAPGAIIGTIAGIALSLVASSLIFNHDGKISRSEIVSMLLAVLPAMVGGVIGFIPGGPAGALIGMTVGAGLGMTLVSMNLDDDGKLSAKEFIKLLVDTLIIIGGITIGFVAGGPAGAAIGATVGFGLTLTMEALDLDVAEFIDNILSGLWEGLGLKNIYDECIKPCMLAAWNAVLDFLGIASPSKKTKWIGEMLIQGTINGLTETWQKLENWWDENVAPIFTTEFWRQKWESVRKSCSNGMNSIRTVISNIWNSIWRVISNVINSILNGIERFVNSIIRGLNVVINALNRFHIEIPRWVPDYGGKKLGFNIQNISTVTFPRLATGTYIPANYGEFAAILGDNKREPEVVSPISAMKQAFREALSESGGGAGGSITINLVIDRDIVGKAFVEYHNGVVARTRMSPLKGVG